MFININKNCATTYLFNLSCKVLTNSCCKAYYNGSNLFFKC